MKFKNVAQPIPMAAPIANEGDKNIIPLNSTKTNLASLKDGFPEITQKSPDEGGLPPVRADFNGMFYLSTDQRIYLQNGGVITFSQAVSDEIGGYPKGAVLDFVDDNLHVYKKVRSLIDDNTYDFVKDISFIDGIHWEELKFSAGSGVELGTVVCMPFGVDESENKYRYLNGQVIIQTQYPAFTAKVKKWQETRSSLFTTETNWQAEKTASALGQCGKFVIDDTAGTIRLPLVININGLSDLNNCGLIKYQSLPNITATWGSAYEESNTGWTSSGAVSSSIQSGYWMEIPGNSAKDYVRRNFNANYSNGTYQDGAPVQQDAIQYPYVICVNTGVEEAERPINDYTVNNPYAYGMSRYCQGAMNNNSWLKSSGQFNNGTVYTGLYAWLLDNVNNNKDGFKLSTATDITDYDFVVNTTNQTFRLPLLNGSEDLPSNTIVQESNGNISIEAGGNQTLFKATCNGFVVIRIFNSTTGDKTFSAFRTGDTVGSVGFQSGYAQQTLSFNVKAGDIVSVTLDNSSVQYNYYYYKAVGNGSLYYYCGDTLQNVDLINIARLQETIPSQAAHAAMPSYKYIDLTLGASGTTYTAPADGYIHLTKVSNANNQFITIDVLNKTDNTIVDYNDICWCPVSGNGLSITLNILKNRTFAVNYTTGGDTVRFRFVYAEGAQ